MTWLDEIEKEVATLGYVRSGNDSINRAVRVLRELSVYIKASLAVEAACLEFGPVDMGKLNNDRLNAWDALSDDARNIVEAAGRADETE